MQIRVAVNTTLIEGKKNRECRCKLEEECTYKNKSEMQIRVAVNIHPC